MRFGLTRRRLSAVGAAAAAVVVGIFAVAIARRDPADSFSGGSVFGSTLELAAGWSLVIAGLAAGARRRRNRVGWLLCAAGIAWFLPEWSSPSSGSAFAFTAGLTGLALCPPLIAHAALAYPRGRLGRAARPAVATAYIAAVALLGVVPAAAFDPHDQGCAACPYNLASVRNDPGLVEAATRWGLRIALVSTIALAGLLVWRAVSAASTTRVVTGPVHTAAAAYLALVAVDVEHSLRRNFLSNDAFDMRLWRWEAGGLVLIAVGVAWGLHRARQARTAVARLVLELASVPAPGGVRDALASALGDPTLRLAYRRDPDGGYVDAAGRVADLGSGADHASTPLMRGGRPIAVIVHDVRVLDRPGVLEDAVAAAHLAIENERLQAEVRAQLEDLRRSRVRIVETADEARRRLERDLHDGAQQRLVGLVLLIRMLQSRLAANEGTDPPRELAEADGELRAALEELRDLAHGIFPAVLADEGLGAALETLAESHATAIELGNLPEERFDSAIENAAYAVVVETLKQARPTRVRIRARRSGSLLIVELESDGDIDLPLSHLEDRVGALDGRLTVNTAAGRIRVRAELPCG